MSTGEKKRRGRGREGGEEEEKEGEKLPSSLNQNKTGKKNSDPNFTFAYVPSHLHHMLFELVKNSLRAVNDRFESDDSGAEAPPVRLVVAEGDEDITLKVSDEGGGIPRSGLPRIWTYLYSTARSPLDDMEKEGEGDDGPAVLGELERERGEEEGEKKRARKARGGRKRRRRDSLFLKIKNTSKTKQNAQLATATASRSRGSTRDISVAICRLSRWRVRETVFSFFFFPFSCSSRFLEGRKLNNSKNKLTIFPYRFSFSLFSQNNHQQDMARTPTCTSTGWGTCRSRCREAGGERERCWAFSDFFLCFSCLIRITDDPTAQNTFQSLYILFFVHACCARACAPFALLSECVARAPRSARFNFVPPP